MPYETLNSETLNSAETFGVDEPISRLADSWLINY
jgi:hypothetical protein